MTLKSKQVDNTRLHTALPVIAFHTAGRQLQTAARACRGHERRGIGMFAK